MRPTAAPVPAPSRLAALLLLVAVAALPPGCALFKRNLEAPEVTLVGISPESMGRSNQTLLCRLRLDNPNDEELDVRGAEVTLQLADVSAARGKAVENFVLPPYGSQEVDIRVELDLLSALPGLFRFATSGQTELPYTLKGYVDLDVKGLGRLPFKDKGTVKMDQLMKQLPGLLRGVPDRSPVRQMDPGAPGTAPL